MSSTGAITGPGGQRPLTYWVRLVADLAESAHDRVLDDAGLTRRHWQVLSVVREGASSTAQVDAVLAPGVRGPGGAGTTAPLVDDLRRRGWVAGPDHLEGAPDVGGLAVTVAGEEAFEDLREQLAHGRDGLGTGVAARDHEVTVMTLQQVARNLGWTGDA